MVDGRWWMEDDGGMLGGPGAGPPPLSPAVWRAPACSWRPLPPPRVRGGPVVGNELVVVLCSAFASASA